MPFLSVTHIDILYTVMDDISLLVTICLEVFEKGTFSHKYFYNLWMNRKKVYIIINKQ